LVSMVEEHSRNLDDKAYGRRLESMSIVDIGALPAPGVDASIPLVDVPLPHNQPGFEYIGYDDNLLPTNQVPANQLIVGKEYFLRLNNGRNISVTIRDNNNPAGYVIFSHIDL